MAPQREVVLTEQDFHIWRKTSRHTSTNVSTGLLFRGDPVSRYLSHVGFIWESHCVPDLKH